MNNPFVKKVGLAEEKRQLGNGPGVSFFAFAGKHIIGIRFDNKRVSSL